jgi:hypothetical protein
MRLRDQTGAMMPLAAVAIVVVLLFVAFGLEIARAMNERERLKGATEAASLAGALQAVPILGLNVPQSRYACSRDAAGQLANCGWEYQTVSVSGTEAEVVQDWWQMAGCGAGDWRCQQPVIACRGVTYPEDTVKLMIWTYQRNISPAPDVTSALGPLIMNDKQGTTTVSAIGRMKTSLGRLLGRQYLDYGTWSQAEAQLRPLPWPDSGQRCGQ